jgi:hypothetical protein
MGIKVYFLVFLFFTLMACKEQQETVAYSAAEILQLAPPQVRADSLLFNQQAKVNAEFTMNGVQIRYTSDGSEVTETSMLYENTLIVSEPSEFMFRAFHPVYLPSKPIALRLLKVKQDISTATVSLTPQPDKNYSGDGAMVLVDLQKGSTQFRAGNYWLGFQGEQIKIKLELEKEMTISKFIISSLNDHGSWIFLPKHIRVVVDGNKIIGEVSVPIPTAAEPKNIALLDVPVKTGSFKNIEVQIDVLETIPQWHQGAGTSPFFFIDEILVE